VATVVRMDRGDYFVAGFGYGRAGGLFEGCGKEMVECLTVGVGFWFALALPG
jgi:hypothetical protein